VYDGIQKIKTGEKRSVWGGVSGTLSKNTQKSYVQIAKRFYLWIIEEGYNTKINPDKIKAIKLPKAQAITKTASQMLTEDEIIKILDSCYGADMVRDRALISVLYEAGLRINEIGSLKWDDVTFDAHFVKLNVCSKTNVQRYIPLVVSRSYLASWKSIYPNGDPIGDKPVFISVAAKKDASGKRTTVYQALTYKYIRYRLSSIIEQAGIEKKVTPHIFRHSRVTNMLQQGYPESTIKNVCWGSLTSNMLANYGHLCNQDTDAAMARMAGVNLSDEEKRPETFRNKICPRCNHINNPGAISCEICGELIDKNTAIELEKAKETIHNDARFIDMLHNIQEQLDAQSRALSLAGIQVSNMASMEDKTV